MKYFVFLAISFVALGTLMLSGCGDPQANSNPSNPIIVKKESKVDSDGNQKTKIETETTNTDGSITKTKETKEIKVENK